MATFKCWCSLLILLLVLPAGQAFWSSWGQNQVETTTSSTRKIPVNYVTKEKKTTSARFVLLQDEEDLDTYSRCLSPSQASRDEVLSEGSEYSNRRHLPGSFRRRFLRRIRPSRTRKTTTLPGTLILLRCGESEYNANQTFTGWLDPDLSPAGIEECRHAGQLLVSNGFDPDVVYTSRLKRGIKSAYIVLEELDALFLPVKKSYRLNQRMYGSLQGLPKRDTALKFGTETVQAWRNSLTARPPPLSTSDPSHPIHDRRYADLLVSSSSDDGGGGVESDGVAAVLPTTESLLDCQQRAQPLWEYQIRDDIARGKTVLVVGHRDSLRGLIKLLDNIDDDEIQDVYLPNAVPLVYRFNETLEAVRQEEEGKTSNSNNKVDEQIHPAVSGTFMEKKDRLKNVLYRQERWERGSSFLFPWSAEESAKPSSSIQTNDELSMKESLYKMRVEKDLVAPPLPVTSRSNKNKETLEDHLVATYPDSGGEPRWTDDPCEFEEYDFFSTEEPDTKVVATVLPLPPEVKSNRDSKSNSSSTTTSFDLSVPMDGPFVVFIRHGRTPHNNLGLFTGWEDPPLATEGVEDAKNAGRILRRHNFQFDVCYTSWLTRAIDTAFYVLDELDSLWLPMIKSWRLNERMYGDLTGKSKQKVSNEYGAEQLKKWRRGYNVRPPPTSTYSPLYPGNDIRRAKHFDDIPISWRQTVLRSIEARRLQMHRSFPKTESLKDCMDRSIPFYTERIRKEAIENGKRVLITSHENAIRGILMHLCDIPEEAMNQLHLPNGLPLVYNVKGRCISLLDDGSGSDPMEQHDFGPAAQYLFTPCELGDDFYNSMLMP